MCLAFPLFCLFYIYQIGFTNIVVTSFTLQQDVMYIVCSVNAQMKWSILRDELQIKYLNESDLHCYEAVAILGEGRKIEA